MRKDAIAKGEYRYSLLREWDGSNPKRVAFVLLNPSTADDSVDDQTTKVCIEFAKRWGFGSLEIVNLFAYRATKPKDLKAIKDYERAVGSENHIYLQNALQRGDKIVVAWGEHGKHLKRYQNETLKKLFSQCFLECFYLVKGDQPKHPLCVNYETPLIEYDYYRQFWERPNPDEGIVHLERVGYYK